MAVGVHLLAPHYPQLSAKNPSLIKLVLVKMAQWILASCVFCVLDRDPFLFLKLGRNEPGQYPAIMLGQKPIFTITARILALIG